MQLKIDKQLMFAKIKFRIMSSSLYWQLFKLTSKAKYKMLAPLKCDFIKTVKFVVQNPRQNVIIAIRHYKWRIETKLKYK